MEQYKAAVPEAMRVNGWLYDANSGVLMGVASDQQKAKYEPNVVFTDNRSGCPHKLVIHGPRK